MKRVTEPSTWAGIAALAQLLKAFFPAHAIVIDAVTAAAGAAAVTLTEGKAK